MRVSIIRNRLSLLLLFLSISPVYARGQDQTPAPRPAHGWLDPTVSDEYKKWLREDVVFIITDEERADFKKLIGDKQRDDFIVAFWERRNPIPGAPENKFKEEHYRRIAYANTHFAAGIPGWKTDRGRTYIMFGPPDSIEHHPSSAGQHSRESWRYHLIKDIGENVTFEFVDTCECGEYQMTIETSEKLTPLRQRQEAPLQSILYVPWHKWLDEDVRYIITDQERRDFLNLTNDKQRDEFIEAFWERRNPDPGSEENKFKEKHYARIAYSNERFAAGTPGWETDRGRFYIMYGPPDESEQLPERTDATPATADLRKYFSSDVWRYYFIKRLGHDVFFVFLDKCGSGTYLSQHDPFQKRSKSADETVVSEETPFLGKWAKWLSEDVCYIITTQEVAEFYKLDSEQDRDKFVEDFWNRRNPKPGSQENKFKEEHYRRIAYANQHFAADIPGWKTDRGHIYILYGPPDSIDRHYSDAGSNSDAVGAVTSPHDSEVWHYRLIESIGKDIGFTFVDTCMCGRFERQIFWERMKSE